MFLFNLILFAIVSVLIGGLLSSTWGLTKKLLIGASLVFAINALLGYLFFLLKISIDSHIFIFLYVLVGASLLVKLLWIDKLPLRQLFSFQKTDLVVIITSLLLLGILVIPSLRSKPRSLTIYPTRSEDIVNHFFVASGINSKGGYIYKDLSLVGKIPTDLINYPQGAHYNFAILEGAKQSNFLIIFRDYRVYYPLCYLIFFGLFVTAALDLLGKKLKHWMQLTLAGAICLTVFSITIVAPVYLFGFLAQLIAMGLFIALMI